MVATPDILQTMADTDDTMSPTTRLVRFYFDAAIYGDGYGSGGDNSAQQAELDQINGQADAMEAERDAAYALEGRATNTVDHRLDVDVPAAASTLTAKQAELKALQDAANGPVPAAKQAEYDYLVGYGATNGIPIP